MAAPSSGRDRRSAYHATHPEPEGTSIATQRLLVALLAAAAVLSACADAPSGVEVTLPGELAGLPGGPPVELDVERVAADALDPEALASLLADADFEGAIERTYAGPNGDIRRVEVRVVRFGTPEGAERYLSWLRSHASEVIGALADTRESEAGLIFIHEPGGCCPKELPLAMGVWRSGPEVIRVVVAGPAADGPAGAALLLRLHGRTSRGA